MIKLTLGNDSNARKDIQLVAAFLRYIPAAAVKFALHSKAGNEKHNKGEPVHHARGKSGDHEECILRHLVDLQDIEAFIERNGAMPDAVKQLLDEATAEFWRAGIFLQELCERYEGAPLAPGARLPEEKVAAPLAPGCKPRPQIVDGTPHGARWAVVDGDGNCMALGDDLAAVQRALDAALGFPGPINTPAEAAELEKAQGTVRLVAVPPGTILDAGEGARFGNWLTDGFAAPVESYNADDEGPGAEDGPEFEGYAERAGHGFPLFKDCPSERGNGVDEAGLERCGHMSRTKRVCSAASGHAGAHGDGIMIWAGVE